MYLVDTNVLSEARRGTVQAASWLGSVRPQTIYISTLSLGEIMRGVALKQKNDPVAAGHLSAWLHRIRDQHAGQILPVTDRISVEWGRVAAIRPRGDIDGLLAATAIVHDLIIVTRNVSDFADTGVDIIDPWNAG